MNDKDTKEVLQETDSEDGIICRVVSSVEKVFPKISPDQLRGNLSGLRGETVSFQIAYFWNGKTKLLGDVEDVSIIFNEKNREGRQFSGNDIRIRKVMLVPCTYPNHRETDEDYLVTEPGMYPDLLRDLDNTGFPLISGQWRSIWIDFSIPKDAAAGMYEICFVLKNNEKYSSDKAFREKITVNLEIVDIELPELTIPHTEWLHCDCLANYYQVPVFSEEHWQILTQFVEIAVKRGCNMLYTPIFTPPLDTVVGGERKTVQLIDVYMDESVPHAGTKYLFDFERFERWIQMGESCGVQYYEISHLFTQWGAVAAPKIVASIKGKTEKIFGWETEAGGDAYRNFLEQFLTAFDKELHRLNIQDRVYFHISDEPTKEQLHTYKAANDQVSEYLKNYHIIDAVSNYDFYETGLIKEPVCASNHIAQFLEQNKRPDRLWVYYCTAQNLNVSNRFISMPGSRTRIIGDMIYRHNIDGFLHWGFNFYNSEYSLYPIDPYRTTDADGAFPSGDPFLIYPGENGVPEESVRIMLMDEAFADHRALKLLEDLTDRENALQCLDEDTFGELKFDRYPKEKDYVLRVRENINQKIKTALTVVGLAERQEHDSKR